MSTEKTLDGFLRPAFELRTLIYILVAAPLVLLYSDILGFSYESKMVFLLLSLIVFCVRLRSLIKIKRYQQNLNNIDPFFIKPEEIPWTKKEQWIGKGFVVTNVHAQRIWDANKTNLKTFYSKPRFNSWFRNNELIINSGRTQLGSAKTWLRKKIAAKSSKHHFKPIPFTSFKLNNPFKPDSPVGGNSVYHAVGVDKEQDVMIPLADRKGHCICLGQSRVGKTVFLVSQVVQDLARKDCVSGVFDPKADLELLGTVWAEAKKINREGDFYCFLLGEPEISAKYNAIASFTRLTAIAGRISSQMGGDSGVFQDFAFDFMVQVSGALLTMGEQPTFKSIKANIIDLESLFNRYGRYLMKRDNPNYIEELKELEKPKFKLNTKGEMVEVKIKVGALKGREYRTLITNKLTEDFYERNPQKIDVQLESLRATMRSDSQHTNKLTASLIPLLTKLTSGQLADIISPNYNVLTDTRREFSWDKIIQRKGIFYAGFNALQDEVVAQSIGNLFFADLIAKAGEINAYGTQKGLLDAKTSDITPIRLHCDEFQSLMSEDWQSLLNRSGSSGVEITAYSQVLADVEAKLGDAAKAKVILGNFNNIIMLRVANKDTAEYLCEQVGSCDRLGLEVSGATTDGGALTPSASMKVEDDEDGKSSSSDSFFGTKTQSSLKVEAHEPIITPEMIMSLPKGQAFAFINRQYLWKLRFPIIVNEGEDAGDMTRIRKELARQIKRKEGVT